MAISRNRSGVALGYCPSGYYCIGDRMKSYEIASRLPIKTVWHQYSIIRRKAPQIPHDCHQRARFFLCNLEEHPVLMLVRWGYRVLAIANLVTFTVMLITEEDVLPRQVREHTSLDPASFTLSTLSIALLLSLALHILDLVLAGELTSTARLKALIRWSERKIPVAPMYVNEQREHERLACENSSFVKKCRRNLTTFVVVNRMLRTRPASQPPPISVGELSVFEILRFRLLALAQPPRVHSTIFLRLAWLLSYLVYASYSHREACFISPGSATQCDDWDTDRAPWWLYCCDAVLLWSFSLRMFARSLFQSKAHDGRSRGIFLTHLQLPVVLLLWREIWLLVQRANTRQPLVHISMQLGWLRLLLFCRSRMMEFAAQSLLTTHTQARLFVTAVNLVSIVLFFSGLMHFLLGSTNFCGPLPMLNDTAFENVIAARTEAAKHLSGGFPELLDNIELGCELANVYTLHDYIYFTVVTISTVGYGDFYPPDGVTRTVAITLMLVLLTYIPLEFSNLVAMLNEMRHFCIGTPPTRWNAVVALIGPISAQQLSMFLFDFFQGNHNLDPNARIVVLSPLPLSEYHPVVKHWRARSSAAHIRRLYIECNDVLSLSKKGKVPLQVAQAKAIFVFSDSEAPAALAEDRRTVVRCLVLRKLLPAQRMRIVSVQFNRAMDKALAMEMGVRSAIALNELKMALFAVSATRCFGLTTLLCNMLRPQKQLPQANHPAAGTGSLDEYLVGVAYGPYLVELPKCCVGRPWKELVESLFVELQIVLLGRVRVFTPCKEGETSVQQHRDDVLEKTVSSIELAYEQSVSFNFAAGARHSGGQRTDACSDSANSESQGDTDGRDAKRDITYLEVEPCSMSAVEPHCFALVLAPSAEVAELLRLLPRLPRHTAVATEQDEEGVRAARKQWQALLKMEAAQAGSSDRQESFTKRESVEQPVNKESSQPSKNEPSQPKIRAPVGGSMKSNVVAHAVYAEQCEQIFISDEDAIESEHVGQRPFVLAVCGAWPANLRIFVETVIGEGQYAVVLLCSVPPPTPSDKHMLCAYVNDEEKPLVHVVTGDVRSQQQLLRAGMQYARSIVVLSSFRGTGVSAEETITDPNQCDMGVALLHAKIQKAMLPLAHAEGRSSRRIPVLTEVHHANASRFLDETSWWPEDELDDFAFVQAPAYASGRCFAESMCAPASPTPAQHSSSCGTVSYTYILAFALRLYPLVNYSYIMPLLMLLMQEILQIQDHDACYRTGSEKTEPSLQRERLRLWRIPPVFVGYTFGDLFRAMLRDGLLAMGLLRAHDVNDEGQGQYVLTAPPHTAVIGPRDRVYVLLPTTQSLGESYKLPNGRRPTSGSLFTIMLEDSSLCPMSSTDSVSKPPSSRSRLGIRVGTARSRARAQMSTSLPNDSISESELSHQRASFSAHNDSDCVAASAVTCSSGNSGSEADGSFPRAQNHAHEQSVRVLARCQRSIRSEVSNARHTEIACELPDPGSLNSLVT